MIINIIIVAIGKVNGEIKGHLHFNWVIYLRPTICLILFM